MQNKQLLCICITERYFMWKWSAEGK